MTALRVILPVVLGILAAVLNFMVLRGSTAPLEVTVVRSNLLVDTVLTEDMLERLQVRADATIFKSAPPYSERGLLLGRRLKRALEAGEILLYADLENLDETNVRPYLKPGETTLTIPASSSRIAPGLRRGDSIGVIVTRMDEASHAKNSPATPTARILGPFRLLRLGPVSNTNRMPGEEGMRQVIVAVASGKDGKLDPAAAAVQEAIIVSQSSNNRAASLSVEHYLAGATESTVKPLGTSAFRP
jgi:hypothetical protein